MNREFHLPQDTIHQQVDVLVEHANLVGNELRRLFFVESIVDSVKVINDLSLINGAVRFFTEIFFHESSSHVLIGFSFVFSVWNSSLGSHVCQSLVFWSVHLNNV